jgi:hypothetical protein
VIRSACSSGGLVHLRIACFPAALRRARLGDDPDVNDGAGLDSHSDTSQNNCVESHSFTPERLLLQVLSGRCSVAFSVKQVRFGREEKPFRGRARKGV